MRQVAEQAGFNVRTLLRDESLTAADLAATDLWLTPAADGKGRNRYGFLGRYASNVAMGHYMADKHYDALVTEAVAGGMGYLGCCAGAYWAIQNLQLAGPRVRDLATKTDAREKIAVVGDGGAPRVYEMDLLDGPAFVFLDRGGPAGVTVIGRYEAPPNAGSDVAMISTTLGRGQIFLSGPHPEASLSGGLRRTGKIPRRTSRRTAPSWRDGCCE